MTTTKKTKRNIPAKGYSLKNREVFTEKTIKKIMGFRKKGCTANEITKKMNKAGFRTISGRPWTNFNVNRYIHVYGPNA